MTLLQEMIQKLKGSFEQKKEPHEINHHPYFYQDTDDKYLMTLRKSAKKLREKQEKERLQKYLREHEKMRVRNELYGIKDKTKPKEYKQNLKQDFCDKGFLKRGGI